MKRVLLAVPIALVGSFASPAAPDLEAERAALIRLDKEWAQAAAAKDVEKVVSFWASDAKVFPPGQPVVVGQDAIRKYVTEGFALPGFSIQWETNTFIVSPSGDMAYGAGTNTVSFNGPQGTPVVERGRAITVWRKTQGEGWKCVVDIWNAEPSAPPPAR